MEPGDIFVPQFNVAAAHISNICWGGQGSGDKVEVGQLQF